MSIQVYTYKYACMYVYIYRYIQIRMYRCIYIYMLKYTHTDISTHMDSSDLTSWGSKALKATHDTSQGTRAHASNQDPSPKPGVPAQDYIGVHIGVFGNSTGIYRDIYHRVDIA